MNGVIDMFGEGEDFLKRGGASLRLSVGLWEKIMGQAADVTRAAVLP